MSHSQQRLDATRQADLPAGVPDEKRRARSVQIVIIVGLIAAVAVAVLGSY